MNTELKTNETPDPIQLIQALINFIEDLQRDAVSFLVPNGESVDWFADRMVGRLDGPSQRELFARARVVMANREGMRGIPAGTEEGDKCNRRCDGVIEDRAETCYCSAVNAPCGSCESDQRHCPECGWEAE